MRYIPGVTEIAIVAWLFGNVVLARILFQELGIGALIGWGFGFFLVTGAVYLYWDARDRKRNGRS